METFIARQPILNENKRLFAYELLYRGKDTGNLSGVDGNRATSSVLTSAFLTEGLEKISNNKPCFINFTEELLIKNIPASFPPNKIIVEILEDVQPTTEVVAACKKLKEEGYILALDDFVYEEKLKPLIQLADIIKFDLRLTPVDTIHRVLYRLSSYKIKYLAEKVESYEEFEMALKLGFVYFQGFFFATPEKIRIKEIAANKLSLLQMLAEINRPDISTSKLTAIISADVSLSYKLLRYVNSSYFYRVSKVESIAQAVAFLGENEIKRFVTLLVISEIASEKPVELVRLAAVRAQFCNLLGTHTTVKVIPSELFMLGLFSLLPAMLDSPMETIVSKLPLSQEIKEALTLRRGQYAPFLQAVVAYEKREKEKCRKALCKIQIEPKSVYEMYLESVGFAETLSGM